MDPSFALNGSTLATIGALLGALSGAITWLTKALLSSKDEQIQQATREADLARMERDYFRDVTLRMLDKGERAASTAEEAVNLARERVVRRRAV